MDKVKNKVLVIGDSCDDIFIYGRCTRICPEAPVPVFNPLKTDDAITMNPGMAGNVYANLLSLGWEASLLTNENHMVKTRYIDHKSNQMLIRVDGSDESTPLENINIPYLRTFPLIIVADYNKGFLTESDMKKISSAHDWVFLDTKKYLGNWSRGFRHIKINESEYESNVAAVESIDDMDEQLVVTLGGKGCKHKNLHILPEKDVQTIDVSGAGDTFMAAFATKLFETEDIGDALRFANKCSLKVIQERGVTVI